VSRSKLRPQILVFDVLSILLKLSTDLKGQVPSSNNKSKPFKISEGVVHLCFNLVST
jgi:hypothetical protein